MKIFFTASLYGSKHYQHIYDTCIKAINESNCEPISLEVLSYSDLLDSVYIAKLPQSRVHYLFMKKAIEICDAGVIECSTSSFKLGHEATLLLSKDKPLLLLKDKEPYPLNDTFDNCKTGVYKDELDVLKRVKKFIIDVKERDKKERKFATHGDAIKSYRKRLGLSQLDLEIVTSLASGHISRIENGKITPNIETLLKIASALELSRAETVKLLAAGSAMV